MTGSVQWSAWRCSLATPSKVALKHHSLNERTVLLIEIRDDQGTRWTEAAPLPGWSEDSLQENEMALAHLQKNTPAQALEQPLPMALSTAVGLLTIPPARQPIKSVESNALLLNDDDLNATLLGSSCVKMKVGQQSLTQDIQRIKDLLTRLSGNARLRLDANQSWTYDDVKQLSSALGDDPRIDYIEEPLQNELNYKRWSDISTLNFAHDERLATANFAPNVHCKALVIKPTILGWQRTLDYYHWAQQHNKAITLSSSFESKIALNLMNNLALHWQLNTEQGLATDQYFNNTMQTTGDLPLANLTHIERLL